MKYFYLDLQKPNINCMIFWKKKKKQFDKIKIEVKNSDKINFEQQYNFVNEYFKRFNFGIYFLIF